MAAKNIQVGQQWLTRSGKIATVVRKIDNVCHPFECAIRQGKFTVTDTGSLYDPHQLSKWDLVEKVSDPCQKPSIEVGQVWIARNGRSVRIVQKLDFAASKDHPWVCEDSMGAPYTVNDEGFEFTALLQTPHDLIERVSHPPLTAANPTELQLSDEALTELESMAPTERDAAAVAIDTLNGMGYRFDGQCWSKDPEASDVTTHPLYPVFMKAIEQAMFGKGQRHGGSATPFFDQPWVHYAKMHGRGFLTGQSAKKLEEAASLRSGEAFETEVLGALVYAGMSIIYERSAT